MNERVKEWLLILQRAAETGVLSDERATDCIAQMGALPPEEATTEWLIAQGVLRPHQVLELRARLGTVSPAAEQQPPPGHPAQGGPADEAEFPDIPGYQILGVLGRGGMGLVYKAYEESLGRVVAIKLLPPSLAMRPASVERFRREARAMAALRHPNIVVIYGVGEVAGQSFIAMEFVDGYGLNERLARQACLEPGRVVRIALQVADALSYAHKNGVVHRDLKPSNIVIERNTERAKVTDFGVARIFGELASSITGEGAILGTPHYMSPEQVEGQEVDHRADIYALGVIMYELLSGQLPYRADTPLATMRLIAQGEPKAFPRSERPVPEALLEVVEKAMHRDRSERFSDMDQFTRALYQSQRQPSAPAPSATPEARQTLVIDLSIKEIAVAAVVVVLLAAGLLLLLGPGKWTRRMRGAHSLVLRGHVAAGLKELRQLRIEAPDRYQEKIDRMMAQASLELYMSRSGIAQLSSPRLNVVVTDRRQKPDELILDLMIENMADEQLLLKNEFFYLRGAADIVQVADGHPANSLDGIVIAPRSSSGGSVVFQGLPGLAVHVEPDGSTRRYWSLIFNDGDRYLRVDIGT